MYINNLRNSKSNGLLFFVTQGDADKKLDLGRSGLEFACTAKEPVELLLPAIDEGMRVPDAADFAGVRRRAAKDWAAGSLPR